MTQHIFAATLLVPDYDVGIAFYVGKLGFTLVEETPLPGGKRWVRVAPKGAATCLLIARATTPAQNAALGRQTGDRVGFFLQTDDFIRDHRSMIEAGIQFEESPRHEAYGIVAVWRDPFGNRWDLIEFTDAPS